MKKAKKCDFFDGQLFDGKSTMRFVGFSSRFQQELDQFKSQNETVVLKDCEVKAARRGSNPWEVIMKHDTQLKKSPQKIDP